MAIKVKRMANNAILYHFRNITKMFYPFAKWRLLR